MIWLMLNNWVVLFFEYWGLIMNFNDWAKNDGVWQFKTFLTIFIIEIIKKHFEIQNSKYWN